MELVALARGDPCLRPSHPGWPWQQPGMLLALAYPHSTGRLRSSTSHRSDLDYDTGRIMITASLYNVGGFEFLYVGCMVNHGFQAHFNPARNWLCLVCSCICFDANSHAASTVTQKSPHVPASRKSHGLWRISTV